MFHNRGNGHNEAAESTGRKQNRIKRKVRHKADRPKTKRGERKHYGHGCICGTPDGEARQPMTATPYRQQGDIAAPSMPVMTANVRLRIKRSVPPPEKKAPASEGRRKPPFQNTQGKSARWPTAFTSISQTAGSPPGNPVFRVSDTFGKGGSAAPMSQDWPVMSVTTKPS